MQAADYTVVEIVSFIRQLVGSESDGNEEIGGIALIHAGKGKDKGCRHHTDNGEDLAIERNGATHNVRHTGKFTLPESMTENRHGMSWPVFVGSEDAAKDWSCAKQREEIGVCAVDVDALRFCASHQVELVATEGRQRNEGVVLPLESKDVWGANRNRIRCDLGNVLLNKDEAVGRIVGQRTQDDGINDTKNGGGCADAKGEGDDGHEGETGIFAELANTVAAIEESRMEPIAHALVANLFLHLFDAAKFHARGALRLVRGHARTNVFFDQQGEMGMNFVVKAGVDATREKAISQEASEFCCERHASHLTTASAKLGRWPRRYVPIARFQPRAAFFPAWSSGSISRGDCFRSLPKKKKSSPRLPCGAGQGTASQP